MSATKLKMQFVGYFTGFTGDKVYEWESVGVEPKVYYRTTEKSFWTGTGWSGGRRSRGIWPQWTHSGVDLMLSMDERYQRRAKRVSRR